MSTDAAQARRRNRSVQKAAAVLRVAAGLPDGVTVSELARRAGLPRATALRMVEALVVERFLRRLPDERVALGSGLLALARAADPDAMLLDAAEQPLAELAGSVPETITLTVSRPDGSLEIVRQLDGPRMLGLTNWVGRPFPVHASSSGKLALALGGEAVRRRLPRRLKRHASRTITTRAKLEAELERVRELGYAEIVDELEDGLAAVSVPVMLDGELAATLNASGPTVRFDRRARAAALPALRRTAASIGSRLS